MAKKNLYDDVKLSSKSINHLYAAVKLMLFTWSQKPGFLNELSGTWL